MKFSAILLGSLAMALPLSVVANVVSLSSPSSMANLVSLVKPGSPKSLRTPYRGIPQRRDVIDRDAHLRVGVGFKGRYSYLGTFKTFSSSVPH